MTEPSPILTPIFLRLRSFEGQSRCSDARLRPCRNPQAYWMIHHVWRKAYVFVCLGSFSRSKSIITHVSATDAHYREGCAMQGQAQGLVLRSRRSASCSLSPLRRGRSSYRTASRAGATLDQHKVRSYGFPDVQKSSPGPLSRRELAYEDAAR